MSFPAVILSLNEQKTIYFREDGSVITCPGEIPPRNRTERSLRLRYAVILDKSPRITRDDLIFEEIRRELNKSKHDALRLELTRSYGPIDLSEVIRNTVQGVVAMTDPIIGKPSMFHYYPNVRGNTLRYPVSLGFLGLGKVITPSEYRRAHAKPAHAA